MRMIRIYIKHTAIFVQLVDICVNKSLSSANVQLTDYTHDGSDCSWAVLGSVGWCDY